MKCLFKKSVLIILAVALMLSPTAAINAEQAEKKADFIKWMDFTPTYSVLERTLAIDIETHKADKHLSWIDLLAYLGAKYGGNFKKYKKADLDKLVSELKAGKTMEELTEKMKYYPYYKEIYTAVLSEFVGSYSVQVLENDELVWKEKYGLKVFSPIAKNYYYSHYDDFGNGRSYGFRRTHLGHDMFGEVGVPIMAVETGTVEVMGWNQYGGWRVGIRSLDKKRYYYYAHLRKDRPYHCDLKEGALVKAGDVIGYMGRSGYSVKENVNNMEKNHLHFGIQIIFDESQKESVNEIWIDLYAITKLLEKNKSATVRIAETKEYYRKFDFKEALTEQFVATPGIVIAN